METGTFPAETFLTDYSSGHSVGKTSDNDISDGISIESCSSSSSPGDARSWISNLTGFEFPENYSTGRLTGSANLIVFEQFLDLFHMLSTQYSSVPIQIWMTCNYKQNQSQLIQLTTGMNHCSVLSFLFVSNTATNAALANIHGKEVC